MRPNHLHLMIEAPGYHKLTTALYPDGDQFLATDAVFGVKKSLVVVSMFMSPQVPICRDTNAVAIQKYRDVNDDAEARRRGFPKGGSFKLLQFDIILATEEEAKAARAQFQTQ